MSKIFYLLLFCFVPLDALQSCPFPHIQNGRTRMRQRTRMAKFSCLNNYTLVGNKYATCRLGQWDVPLPVCVRAGCKTPEVENGVAMPAVGGAWMVFFCFPNFRINGPNVIYCDGYKWNSTTPKCVATRVKPQLTCDFESPDICGWTQDRAHDFDWKRLNLKTPSSFLLTGPSYDHTKGEYGSGHYMYIESTSKLENDTARLFSPVYEGAVTKNDSCFSFFYHMYGKTIGGLRVYQIPENTQMVFLNPNELEKKKYLLFEKWGNQGDVWYRNVTKLNEYDDNFQIVIEGIRGASFTSDVAFDDVAILHGADCTAAAAAAVTPAAIISDTCTDRCDFFGTVIHQAGTCGCTADCVTDDDCCADFFELCVFTSGLTTPYDEVDISDTVVPTQRVINNTTTAKSTTAKPTTIKVTTKSTLTTSTTQKPTTSIKTPKPTMKTTTKKVTTVKPKVTTGAPKVTTVKATTKVVPTTRTITTTKIVPTTAYFKTTVNEKSKTNGSQEKQIADKIKAPNNGSSTAVITVLVLLVLSCAGLALLAFRSARGRAALARLRGRVVSDPEVRYLTHDED